MADAPFVRTGAASHSAAMANIGALLLTFVLVLVATARVAEARLVDEKNNTGTEVEKQVGDGASQESSKNVSTAKLDKARREDKASNDTEVETQSGDSAPRQSDFDDASQDAYDGPVGDNEPIPDWQEIMEMGRLANWKHSRFLDIPDFDLSDDDVSDEEGERTARTERKTKNTMEYIYEEGPSTSRSKKRGRTEQGTGETAIAENQKKKKKEKNNIEQDKEKKEEIHRRSIALATQATKEDIERRANEPAKPMVEDNTSPDDSVGGSDSEYDEDDPFGDAWAREENWKHSRWLDISLDYPPSLK